MILSRNATSGHCQSMPCIILVCCILSVFGLFFQNNQKQRNASVAVREEWKVLEDMDFPRLAKLKLPDIQDPADL